MPVVHVLTMPRTVPSELAAAVLSGVEAALVGVGASRIWVDPDHCDVAVMAEVPDRLAPPGDVLPGDVLPGERTA